MAERRANGQFEKGHKLAPGGAREGAGRKPDVVKQSLADLMDSTITLADRRAILKAVVEQAKLGDVRAATFIFDRLYGKPKETIEMSGSDDNTRPIIVNIAPPQPS